ncbi:FAD-binding domain-containing protein [Haloarchaeobius amylolyticus]|uniref:FAD-binding domain-containing protein n=1 Tax=Haloarchaeobius amylolyticus TaxID=1198296 RepID=UPI00226E7005|nr:FAD-binding domain-containing protein [Haloarchaeobius amylolyticus]
MSPSPVVVWHRADLRVADNPALAAAADEGDPVPVFCIDPQYFGDRGLACDDRLLFLLAALSDLDEQYRELGSSLTLLHGDAVDRLTRLHESLDAPVYVNHHTNARHGRERDEALADRGWTRWFDADAIRREVPEPRDGWQAHAEAYFESEPVPAPDSLPANPVESDVTTDAVREEYDLTSEKRDVPRGGRTAALRRLRHFARNLDRYPASISPPAAAEQHCSRLSAYLTFGCLSPREVYRRVQGRGQGESLFESRLFWNQHFRQKLEDFPAATDRAVNPVFRGLNRDSHDPDLVAAWQAGETGFPMVDAGMRALVETGYVNFRLRALCATFFSYVLRQPWQVGADFMYYHLIDADSGINYQQWQMQAGTVGAHPPRIYDPAKQVREHDPEGEYVRQYVPELDPVPDEYLDRPERMPKSLQQEVGVVIGEDYPAPIVDYEAARQRALDRYKRLQPRAEEALSDPGIRRRASLSRRHGRDGEDGGAGEEQARSEDQTSLDQF